MITMNNIIAPEPRFSRRTEIILLTIGIISALLFSAFVVYPELQTQVNNTDIIGKASFSAELTIKYYDHSATSVDWNKVINEGYTPSCYYFCHGITYTLDPTTHIVNNGIDFLFQCKDLNTPKVITCTTTDYANYFMISTSSATPAFTDTGCGGGAGSGQITTGGLADTTATITAGTPAAGSLTTTLTHTWTAAETDTSTQMLCINTEAHTGGNLVLVLEGTYGPDTLHSGDTLSATVQFTITYS